MIETSLPTAYRYGWGCFETLKISSAGNPCYLDQHLARLYAGLTFCRIDLPCPDSLASQIQTKCALFAQEYPDQQGLLRIQIFADLEPVIETGLLPTPSQAPLRVLLLKDLPLSSLNPLQHYKTFNYLLYQLAYLEAQAQNYDEALLLNEKKEIQELSRSNLFFQDREGSWYTPVNGSGLLPGTTRARLIFELKAEQCVLRLEDLKRFKAAFACNSLYEWKAIQSIEVRGLKIRRPLLYSFETD